MSEEIISQNERQIALALAVASDVTSAVVKRLSGGDLSNSINGNTLSRESVQLAAMKTLSDKLDKRTTSR